MGDEPYFCFKRATGKMNEKFFNKWSREMAYTLGFFFGDGCLNGADNSHYFYITSTDRDVIENIAKWMKFDKEEIKEIPENRKDWKNSFKIGVTSPNIFHKLIELGAPPRKSYVGCEFPMELPDEFLSAFALGLLDSDGTIGLKSHESFYIAWHAHKNVINELENRFLKTGLPNRFGTMPIKSNKHDLTRLLTTGAISFPSLIFLYKGNQDLAMARKYKRAIYVVSRYATHFLSSHKYPNPHHKHRKTEIRINQMQFLMNPTVKNSWGNAMNSNQYNVNLLEEEVMEAKHDSLIGDGM